MCRPPAFTAATPCSSSLQLGMRAQPPASAPPSATGSISPPKFALSPPSLYPFPTDVSYSRRVLLGATAAIGADPSVTCVLGC